MLFDLVNANNFDTEKRDGIILFESLGVIQDYNIINIIQTRDYIKMSCADCVQSLLKSYGWDTDSLKPLPSKMVLNSVSHSISDAVENLYKFSFLPSDIIKKSFLASKNLRGVCGYWCQFYNYISTEMGGGNSASNNFQNYKIISSNGTSYCNMGPSELSTSALNFGSDTVNASDGIANSNAATLSVFAVEAPELIISKIVSTSVSNSSSTTVDASDSTEMGGSNSVSDNFQNYETFSSNGTSYCDTCSSELSTSALNCGSNTVNASDDIANSITAATLSVFTVEN